VWVLEGQVFKNIIIKQYIKRRNIELGFLERVPLLRNFSSLRIIETLDKYEKMKLIDGLEVKYFSQGQSIVREGEEGNYFYIIESGTVDCLKDEGGTQKFVRSLQKGEHFGELALIRSIKRTLSVVAQSDTVKILALNRDAFSRILGSIDKFLKMDYAGETVPEEEKEVEERAAAGETSKTDHE